MKALYFTVVFCAFLYGAASNGEAVMTINGIPVEEKNVFAGADEVKGYYQQNKAECASLEDAKKRLEKKKLKSTIRKIIRDSAIKEYGIEISKQEIRDAVDKHCFAGKNPEEMIKEEQKGWNALIYGLELVLKDPDKDKEIYQKYVKDSTGYSYKTWKMLAAEFNTPVKIDRIRNTIPENKEDVYKSSEKSMESLLIEEKLEEKIVGQITVSDDEIAKVFEKKYPVDKYTSDFKLTDDIRKQIKMELMNSKKQQLLEDWWESKYKSLSVKVGNPSYQYLYDYIQDLKDLK